MSEAAQSPVKLTTHGRSLVVLRDDLMRLCKRLRLVRDAFAVGSPTYDELNEICEDASGCLGGASELLHPAVVTTARGPTLGPPCPIEEPEEFRTYHQHRRPRLTGKAAAANDETAMISSNPTGPNPSP